MYGLQEAPLTNSEREALIMEHLPQVRLIARRIHERLPDSVSIDDLISNGTIGLIAAIDNYDASQNVKLKTYAEYRIRGAILDGLRSQDWAPRQKRKLSRQIEAALASAEQKLGRAPTEEEVARELAVPLETYREWLVDTEGLQIGELEIAGGSDESFSLLRLLPAGDEDLPSRVLERAELERLLAQAIGNMPKIERTVLSLYYYEEMNLREIAQIMDLHLSRISQLKTQAILRLRAVVQKRWPGTSGV